MSNKPPTKKPAEADPLASVRLTKPTVDDDGLGEFEQKAEAKPAATAPAPPDPKHIPPPPPPVEVPKYAVRTLWRGTVKGQYTTLKVGKVVSEETHGPGIIEYLTKAGVELELVK